MEEGYIKFKRIKVDDVPVPTEHLTEITALRDKLYELELIGQYPNGVGFGNVSIGYEPDALFIITGSATGGLETLTNQHYARVLKVDVDNNTVWYGGPREASSESMSHYSVGANACIHIHNLKMWERLLNKVPTTRKDITYGTPAMAYEITRLLEETDVKEVKIFVMGGHKEGIMSFGNDLDEVMQVLLEYL